MSSVVEAKTTSSPPPAVDSDSDDGFQDRLSGSDDEETLMDQETVALERRMKTVGIRDGLELGKEDTLQQGFDQGFSIGAARSFQFGVLRGALSTALACGLLEVHSEQVQLCMTQLRALEMDTHLSEDDKVDTLTQQHAATVKLAQELLQSIGMTLSTT